MLLESINIPLTCLTLNSCNNFLQLKKKVKKKIKGRSSLVEFDIQISISSKKKKNIYK